MQGLKDLADTELLAESANTELQVNKQKNMDFSGKILPTEPVVFKTNLILT